MRVHGSHILRPSVQGRPKGGSKNLGYNIYLNITFIFSEFFITNKLTCFFILQEILYVGPVLRCRRPEEVRHEGCEHIEEGPL